MSAHSVSDILNDLAEMEFADIGPFNDGHAGAFWSGAPEDGPATSPWELHTDTDEFLMCVEGSVEIQILEVEIGTQPLVNDLRRIELSAGQFAIVPKGHWHRHHVTAAFRELYLTPGSSEMSFDVDPRAAPTDQPDQPSQ